MINIHLCKWLSCVPLLCFPKSPKAHGSIYVPYTFFFFFFCQGETWCYSYFWLINVNSVVLFHRNIQRKWNFFSWRPGWCVKQMCVGLLLTRSSCLEMTEDSCLPSLLLAGKVNIQWETDNDEDKLQVIHLGAWLTYTCLPTLLLSSSHPLIEGYAIIRFHCFRTVLRSKVRFHEFYNSVA